MLKRRPSKKPKVATTKQRPRTVRLELEDERWVDGQTHPDGFSGVLRDAVSFYRKFKEQQSDDQVKRLLGAVQ